MGDWKPNTSAPLWDSSREELGQNQFFSDLVIEHDKQVGPSCVATTLAMIAKATGANVKPSDFKKITNSSYSSTKTLRDHSSMRRMI